MPTYTDWRPSRNKPNVRPFRVMNRLVSYCYPLIRN